MKTCFAACLLSALSSAVIIGTDPDAYCLCDLEHEPVLCEDGIEYTNACLATCSGQTGCSPVTPPDDDDATPPEEEVLCRDLTCNANEFINTYGCGIYFDSFQDMLDYYDLDNNVCPDNTADTC